MSLRNYSIEIEYDGSPFQGWQRQKNQANTVQEELETGISKLLKKEVKITGAGRTDTGVHAIAQIAHFKTEQIITDKSAFLYSLNSIIPPAITVHKLKSVPDDFHARYSATSREYYYQITTKRKSVYGKYFFKLNYQLDFKVIDEFIKILEGYNSFKSLCKNSEDKHDFNCTLLSIRYRLNKRNGTIIIRIIADRFLHSMVRAITGCLIDLGRGRLDLADTVRKFKKGEKIRTTYLPANALFLKKINYK